MWRFLKTLGTLGTLETLERSVTVHAERGALFLRVEGKMLLVGGV